MGFTISQSINFPKLGIDLANVYVTIKASYYHYKQGSNGFMMPAVPSECPYTLSSRFQVYAYNPSSPPGGQPSDIQPLREEPISIGLDEPPADPIATIYAYIKSEHFAGKTITDDL